jgi:hypothetical protein
MLPAAPIGKRVLRGRPDDPIENRAPHFASPLKVAVVREHRQVLVGDTLRLELLPDRLQQFVRRLNSS